MKKIEKTSLDPIKMKPTDKTKKLVDWLQKERAQTLNELIKICDAAGHSVITILQQCNWAQENGRNPLWGSYGPAQGLRIEQISSFAGKLYQIDQTLEAIYEMWPKLKPEQKEEKSGKGDQIPRRSKTEV